MTQTRISHFKRADAVAALMLLLVHGLGFFAVRELGMRGLLWAWIAYESALLFSHMPFPFTNTLYRAAGWLYDSMNPTLYWGMEVCSALFACAVAGAPFLVMFNALTHGAFLVFAYRRGARPSSRLYSAPRKTRRINVTIIIDNLCHITCLWFYLRAALGDASVATGVWLGLLATVAALTFAFHRDEVRLAHFVHYLRPDLSPRQREQA
jgi:hypothetical protein